MLNSKNKIIILLVEDNMGDAQLVMEELSETGASHFNLIHVERISEAQKIISEMSFDVILLDLGLPDGSGLDTVSRIHASAPVTPIVVMSGLDDEVISAEAMKHGTQDYLVKGQVSGHMLARTLRYAIERKEAEERLKKAKEQAEQVAKLKDKFVSMVTHDLRSPFTSIMGFLKILERDNDHPLNENQKRMVHLMLNSCRGLLDMIDELLNLGRLQTGKIELKPGFIDGYMLSSMVVDRLRGLANKKGIELVNEVKKGTRLYADRELFREVITNLLSNAIKFCDKGDQIVLYVPNDRRTCIAVKDTGIGISPKILPNLFKHEEKTTTKGTAGERGTGLGLPFCKDIMKVHGGTLKVESSKGKGSTFYANLPMLRPLIMLVDDEEIVRFTLKEDLTLLEADFVETEGGMEAVEYLKNKTPHLIITDIRMTGMDGFELIEHIRNNPASKNIPIIVITSGTDMEVRETAFRRGANDFLTKPWELHDLIPRVKRFIL